MKTKREYLTFFINMFTRVTTIVVLASALYICIFWGADTELRISLLWQILGVSAICAAGVLLLVVWEQKYPSKHPLLQNLLQLIYVSAVVMGSGFAFQWFSTSSLSMVLGMEVCIIAVYSTVIWISYFLDWQAAKAINEKLAEREDARERTEHRKRGEV